MITDAEARRRLVEAVERIAAALEAQLANDPIGAIERAISGERPLSDEARRVLDEVPESEEWRLR